MFRKNADKPVVKKNKQVHGQRLRRAVLKRCVECEEKLDPKFFEGKLTLATYISKASIATISIIDDDGSKVIASKGWEVSDIKKENAFNSGNIKLNDIYEIEDTLQHSYLEKNPYVKQDPGIRFYAEVPLVASDEAVIGFLSVADTQPNKLDNTQKEMLKVLAGEVLKCMESSWEVQHDLDNSKIDARFKALVRNSTDVITIFDSNGTFQYLSPSFYRLSGYTEEEVIGKYVPDFMHPDDLERAVGAFRKAVEEPGGGYFEECRFRKANGEWMVFEVNAINAMDDEAVQGVVLNCRDITERKKIEAEIKSKSQLLEGIKSNMPVIIYKIDEKGYFKESMGAGLKRLGLKENEIVGGNVYDLYPETAEHFKKSMAGGADTMILHGVDGDQPWYFEVCTFRDEVDEGVIGFCFDITERKLHEEEQASYAANLEKVNKELDQFAYVISHDLKAPLRAIDNLSQWIEEDLGPLLDDREEIKNNMELLRGRVKRMAELINGVLEYSKAGRSEITLEDIDVGALLTDVVNSIDIPESFILRKINLPVIKTNRIRLEQVFSNLLTNAVKYHHQPSGTITIDYDLVDGVHQFSVADDGPGIAPEHHEKIFGMFQTLQPKDKVGSTGVGLAIVKKIVEELGGTIYVDSERGKGARFVFTLPARKETLKEVA